MSASEARTKGKRFRKPQCGGSNVNERWKYLSAQTNDVVEDAVPQLKSTKKPQQQQQAKFSKGSAHPDVRAPPQQPARVGYDIDGDGQIDVREMRLAKFLDAMMETRRCHAPSSSSAQEPSDAELTKMRQDAGRLLIAKEFVERNQDRLWRYGAIFTGKNDEQSAEYIATHKNFHKLMPFLENLERKRTIRSSQNLRSCVQGGGDVQNAEEDARLVRQTWIETSRKVPSNPSVSKHPLLELHPKKKHKEQLYSVSEKEDGDDRYPQVVSNRYGAIDVDGDGVVDDDEMKLHLRLQEATLEANNSEYPTHHRHRCDSNPRGLREHQQLEGRKMMATDFVQRNEGQLWLYDPSYRDKSQDEIIDHIASQAQFAKQFNKLRAQERVVRLTSSMAVSNCLVQQLPMTDAPSDPSSPALEFRRVRHRTELLLARKELLKATAQHHAQQQSVGSASAVPGNMHSDDNAWHQLRAVREDRQELLSRSVSDTKLVGLPKIFDTPMRIEATGSFSVTKWKVGA